MGHISLLAIAQKSRAWTRFGWPGGVFGPDLSVGHDSPIHQANSTHMRQRCASPYHIFASLSTNSCSLACVVITPFQPVHGVMIKFTKKRCRGNCKVGLARVLKIDGYSV
jgi:hypothetical protein